MTCFGTSAAYISRVHEVRRPSPPRAVTSAACARSARPARRCRPRASAGSTSTSAPTPGCSPRAAARTSSAPSSAGCRRCPCTRASCRAGRWAPRSRPATRRARPVVDEVGELVLTEPLPSMPVFFWGDADGERYRDSYFALYPGIWRHGDWIEITARGTAIISGRSDSTINRGGIRMGTAEIYRAVLALDEMPRRARRRHPAGGRGVVAAAVRRARRRRRAGRRPREGDPQARSARTARRGTCPSEVIAIDDVPRTLSGKALEVPVKRSSWAPRPRRRPAATRWRTPRRSTGSRSWRRAASEPARRRGGGRDRGGRAAARALRGGRRARAADEVDADRPRVRGRPRRGGRDPRGADRAAPGRRRPGRRGGDFVALSRCGAERHIDGARVHRRWWLPLGRRPPRRHAELPARAPGLVRERRRARRRRPPGGRDPRSAARRAVRRVPGRAGAPRRGRARRLGVHRARAGDRRHRLRVRGAGAGRPGRGGRAPAAEDREPPPHRRVRAGPRVDRGRAPGRVLRARGPGVGRRGRGAHLRPGGARGGAHAGRRRDAGGDPGRARRRSRTTSAPSSS